MLYREGIPWWDFERNWTGWIINWFALFPFFLAFFVIGLAVVGLALYLDPKHGLLSLPVCLMPGWCLWSCIKHGD